MNKLDTKYVAGLIDGCGWFGSVKREEGTWSLRLRVEKTTRKSTASVLTKLRRQFGGSVCSYYNPATYANVTIWQLEKKKDILHLLRTVVNDMRIKREQAEAMLRFLESGRADQVKRRGAARRSCNVKEFKRFAKELSALKRAA